MGKRQMTMRRRQRGRGVVVQKAEVEFSKEDTTTQSGYL